MARNGSIGKGWYEDSISAEEKEELAEKAEVTSFFGQLLKEKINECFDKARKNKEKTNAKEMDSKSD